MNLLIVREDELDAAQEFTVTGRKVEHLLHVLHAQPGDSIKTGLYGHNMGHATLLSIDRRSARLRLETLEKSPPPPADITLITALPRPQSMKKVLHFAVSSGIKKIYFIGTERVEKSFWKSSAMTPAALQEEILLGLEQGMDTIPPELFLRPSLHRFLDSGELQQIVQVNQHNLIAHPGPSAQACPRHLQGKTSLLVGPEGGFLAKEVDRFIREGFQCVELGAHILRVEFAVAFLCGRIS